MHLFTLRRKISILRAGATSRIRMETQRAYDLPREFTVRRAQSNPDLLPPWRRSCEVIMQPVMESIREDTLFRLVSSGYTQVTQPTSRKYFFVLFP